jgi:hypothetical protein
MFHHCKLSGHWEAKCWQIHYELDPINHIAKRRVWRVKIAEDEELIASNPRGTSCSRRDISVGGLHHQQDGQQIDDKGHIPMVVFNLASKEYVLEDVPKIGAPRLMNFGGVIKNSMMCLQACVGIRGLFP